MVPRASSRPRSRGRATLPLPPLLRGREGRRGRLVLHLRRRTGRLPRAQRRGKDDDLEGPFGSPLPHRGPGIGRRFPAPGAGPRLPRADHAGDGSEAAAPLGPAAFGNVPPQPGHLRHPAKTVRRHDGRADRAARAGAAPGEARPAALARRADEMRACGGAAASAEVLFLDEPTIGLDVSMQATVRGFVRAYNERFGATVLLTSHYMEDVAALCPRVMVIDKGRLIYDGGLSELIRRVRPDKRMLLRLSRPVERRDLEALGSVIEHRDAEAIVQVSQDALQPAVARALS